MLKEQQEEDGGAGGGAESVPGMLQVKMTEVTGSPPFCNDRPQAESKGRRAAGEDWMGPRPPVFPHQVSNQNTHQGQSVSEAAVSKVAPVVVVLQKKWATCLER